MRYEVTVVRDRIVSLEARVIVEADSEEDAKCKAESVADDQRAYHLWEEDCNSDEMTRVEAKTVEPVDVSRELGMVNPYN